jgi:hypothetical protein
MMDSDLITCLSLKVPEISVNSSSTPPFRSPAPPRSMKNMKHLEFYKTDRIGFCGDWNIGTGLFT